MDKISITYSAQKSVKVGETIARTFDAFDTKGRQFGARVRLTTYEYAETTSEVWNSPRTIDWLKNQPAPGTHYGFRPHAERGGKSYGASQGDRIFPTEAERDAAVEKYFATAERGALKNKARVA